MRRRGYTYAELMIVITIIGILVALLLPAVQACREAARRASCSNNLVQLILAVQNYEIHHGVLPPGTVDATGPIFSLPKGHHQNWLIQILPFLELKNMSRQIDPSISVYDPSFVPLRKMQPDVLACPSVLPRVDGYSDYAGVHHDFEAPIDVDNHGVFFLNSHIRYEDVWDGSSRTLFLGEKWTPRGDLGWMSGTRATLRNTGPGINAGGGLTTWTRAVAVSGEPRKNPVDEASELDPADDHQLISLLLGPRDDLGPPVGRLRRSIPRPKTAAHAVGGFSSRHPGGAQFAMGDGSVQYLSATLDPIIYAHLAHRADGNIRHSDY